MESKPEYQPLEPILRSSLDDPRLTAVDPSGCDLVAVLAGFRARNERRVRAAGLQFAWEMGDLPQVPDFGPKVEFHRGILPRRCTRGGIIGL